jgi:hypothetical protein
MNLMIKIFPIIGMKKCNWLKQMRILFLKNEWLNNQHLKIVMQILYVEKL